jgi:hypothetical protein
MKPMLTGESDADVEELEELIESKYLLQRPD